MKLWNKLQDKYTILCPYFYRDISYGIRCWLNPRNKWVKKSISNRWLDLDTIYENVLFAGIIDYIEGEDALNVIGWDNLKSEKEAIIKIYNWAKTGRAEMQKKLDDSYPPFDISKGFPLQYNNPDDAKKKYEELYGETNRLEKLIYDTDTEYMIWLVTHRNILWT